MGGWQGGWRGLFQGARSGPWKGGWTEALNSDRGSRLNSNMDGDGVGTWTGWMGGTGSEWQGSVVDPGARLNSRRAVQPAHEVAPSGVRRPRRAARGVGFFTPAGLLGCWAGLLRPGQAAAPFLAVFEWFYGPELKFLRLRVILTFNPYFLMVDK
jgi:hypothetical protein